MPDSYPDNNPKTAAGRAKPAMRAVPTTALLAEGQVMVLGEQKYGRLNWRSKVVSASVYYDAIMRHMFDWWEGRNVDPESGQSDLAHVRACCGILIDAAAHGNLNDDRGVQPLQKPSAAGMQAALDETLADAPPEVQVGDLVRTKARLGKWRVTHIEAGTGEPSKVWCETVYCPFETAWFPADDLYDIEKPTPTPVGFTPPTGSRWIRKGDLTDWLVTSVSPDRYLVGLGYGKSGRDNISIRLSDFLSEFRPPSMLEGFGA